MLVCHPRMIVQMVLKSFTLVFKSLRLAEINILYDMFAKMLWWSKTSQYHVWQKTLRRDPERVLDFNHKHTHSSKRNSAKRG